MSLRAWFASAISVMGCVLMVFAAGCGTAAQPTGSPSNNGMIGVELSGLGDGSRDRMFVDLAKTMRAWSSPTNGQVKVDTDGWPESDVETVLFDIRPFGAWNPPIDDPAAFQPDWGGVYSASFRGQADIGLDQSGTATIVGTHYDPASNTTTFQIDVPKNQGLVILSFKNTRRTASGAAGTGFTDLHVNRPGYPLDTKRIFTREFLASLAPFSTLRMMDVLATNHNPGFYGDPGHDALEWSARHVPTDASQVETDGKYGLAWEYIAALANITGKDIWINIPVAATDDYVRHVAVLLKQTLKPGIKVYIEHSNEVWNYAFPQYIYNKLAAIDEVKSGHSTLNNDGSADQEVWAHRRHAKRLVEISNIFRSVFGDDAMTARIRPVYASWTISLDPHFKDPLDWVGKTYGPPSKYFYGMALSHYFDADASAATASKAEILAAMRADSDASLTKYYRPFIALARTYHLKPVIYEGGSSTSGGDATSVGNRILAERDPAMKDLILHDVRGNWFDQGGGLYMYFAHCGSYSRYGCWGLTEDVVDTKTPKYDAIRELASNPAN